MPLVPIAVACTSTLRPCRVFSSLVTARSTFVFMPPHRPLSVVTTIKPARFTSRACMNGCLNSGLAVARCAAIFRTFSA
ncbi:hypothetical protein D3C71_2071180 [compost metagenome]